MHIHKSCPWRCLKSFEKSTPAPPVSRTEAGQSTSAMAVTCSSTSESPPSTSDSHSEAKSEGRANRGRRVQLGKRGAKGKIGKGLKCKNRRIASSSSSSLSPETEGSIDSSPESYRDKPHLVDFIRKPRPPKDSSTFPKWDFKSSTDKYRQFKK